MPVQNATVLLQVFERFTLAALAPIEEVTMDRRKHEPDFMLEDRAKRIYLAEVETKIKHMPVMRKKLAGRDWCNDCTLV